MDKAETDFIRIDTAQYRWVDRDTLEKLVETANGWTWVKVEKPEEVKGLK
jgi:hypothetical protein